VASRVGVLRTREGDLKIVDGSRCILTKDGIYFSLDEDQIRQMVILLTGILDGTHRHIDPASPGMVLAD
jgi:hypothetical protein